jgi:4-hydroxy-tetrahydrodipicolinate reductase
MRVAIIGYGKMGRQIEAVLRERGHEPALIVDVDSGETDFKDFEGIDVAIEFTTPDTAPVNVSRCIEWGVPVVSGTTGWNDRLEEVRRLCRKRGGAVFYASNYSIGVNVFFRLSEYLAGIMNRLPEYGVSMSETHHIHKKDAPSGTAITLAEGIIERIERLDSWVNHRTKDKGVLGIVSVREGESCGIHEVAYSSPSDVIEIKHTSLDRRGLATGAVLAAEFLAGRKGVFGMEDLLEELKIG